MSKKSKKSKAPKTEIQPLNPDEPELDEADVQDFDFSPEDTDLGEPEDEFTSSDDSSGDDGEPDLGPSDSELTAIEEMRNLLVSESARQQDAKKNTDAGTIKNAGRTDEYIEIIIHRHPAVEAAIRGAENAEKETGTELQEGTEPAPEGGDYKSGNSLTGATKPATFAPWDAAKKENDDGALAGPAQANLPPVMDGVSKPDEPKGLSELPNVEKNPETDSIASDAPAGVDEKDAAVKDDLVANLELAGKPVTDEGQLSENVDPLNPNEDGAEKASAVSSEDASDSTADEKKDEF